MIFLTDFDLGGNGLTFNRVRSQIDL